MENIMENIMTDEELFAPLPKYVAEIADMLSGVDAKEQDDKFEKILELYDANEQDALLEKYIAYRNVGFTVDEIIDMYLGG